MPASSLAISRCIISSQNRIYDDTKFRNVIEDNLNYLISKSSLHKVDPMDIHRFKYDFSSYLYKLNIDFCYHWVILRLNDKLYNWEFDEEDDTILLINDAEISKLSANYLMTSRS